MAINAENTEIIKDGLRTVFGKEPRCTGGITDGSFESIHINTAESIHANQLASLLQFNLDNKITHRFLLKRSGEGIKVVYS